MRFPRKVVFFLFSSKSTGNLPSARAVPGCQRARHPGKGRLQSTFRKWRIHQALHDRMIILKDRRRIRRPNLFVLDENSSNQLSSNTHGFPYHGREYQKTWQYFCCASCRWTEGNQYPVTPSQQELSDFQETTVRKCHNIHVRNSSVTSITFSAK